MKKREYRHKEYICSCAPNYAKGDEIKIDKDGKEYVDWGNLPNHRDPRNEWTLFSYNSFGGVCIYCNKEMRENPLAGQVEVIKNGKLGSWQTNKIKSSKEQE